MSTFFNKIKSSKQLAPLLALIILLIIDFIIFPGFFRIEIKNGHLFGSLIDILNRVVPLLIISIGMTLVISTKGIDISVGAVIAISASIACSLINGGVNVWFAIALALGISLICGMWNGMLVAILNIQPMIATLILMTVGRGIAQLITDGQIITINNGLYEFFGIGFVLGLPFPIYIAALVVLVVVLLKKRTAFGLFIESVGANIKSSNFVGINSKRIVFFAYVASALFSGIAGILISANVKSADANNAGLWMELDAIMATVIGGTSMSGGRFYIAGTVIGALFIQTLTTTIYTLGIPPETVMAFKAIVVIVVSLLQSDKIRNLISSREAIKGHQD